MNWAVLEMTTVNKKENLSSRLMFEYKCFLHIATETNQTMLDKEPLPCCELSKNLCHSRLLRYHLISSLFCCHCMRQGLVYPWLACGCCTAQGCSRFGTVLLSEELGLQACLPHTWPLLPSTVSLCLRDLPFLDGKRESQHSVWCLRRGSLFTVLKTEPKALHTMGKGFTIELYVQPFFFFFKFDFDFVM